MRSDISEVLIERPRQGGGLKYVKGEKKLLQKSNIEELPKREKIRQKWYNSCSPKQSTDLLGPLVGWIRKQVGRNWDDIYSEIAQNMPQNSMAKSHVRDHVFDFVKVANQVLMINGKPYDKTHGFHLRSFNCRDRFYVNPITNILCFLPKEEYKYKKPKLHYKWINDTTFYHKIEDIWYEIIVKPVKYDPIRYLGHYDNVFHKALYNESESYKLYDKLVVGVSKRQLGKKEIKKANLRAA